LHDTRESATIISSADTLINFFIFCIINKFCVNLYFCKVNEKFYEEKVP